MNPETKATLADILAICAAHNIAYSSHRRITVGFSNEVHRLNDDLVLKLYRPDRNGKYRTELAVHRSGVEFARPDLVAYGGNDAISDRHYIITRYVPGVSLGHVWHRATAAERERVIMQFSGILRKVNTLDPSLLLQPVSLDWPTVLRHKAVLATDALRLSGVLTPELCTRALEVFDGFAGALHTEQLFPVFWDVHFDNLLVDDQYTILALVDLEDIELAALDYPLWTIQKMITDPAKYLTAENEQFANPADYTQLWQWYERYYPEMFEFAHLQQRVDAYKLLDTLHLLRRWPDNMELQSIFARQLAP